MTTGAITNAINVDENNGDQNGAPVYTGTNTLGMADAFLCTDWTDPTNASIGIVGRTDFTGVFWTNLTDSSCDFQQNIYCFEEPM